MKLPTEIFGDVVVVHTPEELGEDQAAPLRHCLTSQERCNVLLDLDGTESIDSVGLETLLDCQDDLRGLGGELKIAVTNPMNRKILEITRLDADLEIFDSVVDGVRSFTR